MLRGRGRGREETLLQQKVRSCSTIIDANHTEKKWNLFERKKDGGGGTPVTTEGGRHNI